MAGIFGAALAMTIGSGGGWSGDMVCVGAGGVGGGGIGNCDRAAATAHLWKGGRQQAVW